MQTLLEDSATSDTRRRLVDALFDGTHTVTWTEQTLDVRQLRPGMVLLQAARADNGSLLLAEGQTLTEALLERLRLFSDRVGVEEPIRVSVPVQARAA